MDRELREFLIAVEKTNDRMLTTLSRVLAADAEKADERARGCGGAAGRPPAAVWWCFWTTGGDRGCAGRGAGAGALGVMVHGPEAVEALEDALEDAREAVESRDLTIRDLREELDAMTVERDEAVAQEDAAGQKAHQLQEERDGWKVWAERYESALKEIRSRAAPPRQFAVFGADAAERYQERARRCEEIVRLAVEALNWAAAPS